MHPHRTIVRIALVFAFVISVTPIWATSAMVASSEVVNINTAKASELSQLPRIGPALATRILEFREENGAFTKAEDLMLVRGIGDRTFRLLEPFVALKGETTLKRKLSTADAEAVVSPGQSVGTPTEKSAKVPAAAPSSQGSSL